MLVWIDMSKFMKVTLNQLIIYFPSFHFQPTNRSTSQTLTAPKIAPKHFLEQTKTSTTRKLYPPFPSRASSVSNAPTCAQNNFSSNPRAEKHSSGNKQANAFRNRKRLCNNWGRTFFIFKTKLFRWTVGPRRGVRKSCNISSSYFFFALSEGQVSRGLFPERMREGGWC